MEFYSVFCICIFILLLFSVGESILKITKLKKRFIIIFVFISVLFYWMPAINLDIFKLSLNFMLYFIVFMCCVLKTNKLKEFGRILLISLITLAFCVCYNSLNLLKFEFSYFQPYLILAGVLGGLCATLTNNNQTSFAGLFVGVTI